MQFSALCSYVSQPPKTMEKHFFSKTVANYVSIFLGILYRFSLAMAWPKEDQTAWLILASPFFTGQRGYSTEHWVVQMSTYTYDHEKHTQSHKLPLTNTVLLGTMFWVRFGVENIIYQYSWFSLGEPSPWIKQWDFRTNLCRSQPLLLVNNVNIPYQDIIFLIRRRHYLQSHSTVTPIMF